MVQMSVFRVLFMYKPWSRVLPTLSTGRSGLTSRGRASDRPTLEALRSLLGVLAEHYLSCTPGEESGEVGAGREHLGDVWGGLGAEAGGRAWSGR